MDRKIIAVIGPGSADAETMRQGEETGRLIALSGYVLVCGGGTGVMEAAARGARSAEGTTVGILPQATRQGANPYIDIPIATGFGEGRNVVIVRTADLLIAVGGAYGTLSEIALALKTGKPVIGISTWDIPGIATASGPAEAVAMAQAILTRGNIMTEKRDFDKAAATWDEEPRRVALARDVAAAIVDEVRPTRNMDALDFGCGTGLLTLALQPHVRSITGVDSSRGMLQVLEAKVREQGLDNVRSVLCDFESGQRPQGAWHLIVSCMTLHHIPEPGGLFALLYDLLLPGGTICLADLDRENGTFHDEPTGVFHFGFERPYIAEMLRRQGFSAVRDRTAAEIRKGSGIYPVFLITATKPEGA